MSTPFTSLGFNLLPAAATKRLVLFILRHPEKVTQHISSVSKEYDGLSHHWPALNVVAPELNHLRSTIRLKFEPLLAYMEPHADLQPHADGLRGGRKSSMVQGLHPTEDYASTFFWTPDGVEHELSAAQLPAIMDLQCQHAVNNTSSSPRFNFQLSFDYPYEELVQIHAEGKLFRSVPFAT